MTRAPILAAISGVPSDELLSTTMTSVVRSDGISIKTSSIAPASLWVGMMTDTRNWSYLDRSRPDHHNSEDGHRSANHASTPHFRPALPIARPSDANTGTSGSQIHEVPHSEIQRLPRNRNATNAAGRVS